MNFKTIFFILLLIIVVTNILWLYVFINRSVTYDHSQQEITHLKDDINLMRNLMIDFNGFNDKERIVAIIKSKYSNRIIKEEDGALFVDNIGLKFENNKLSGIVFMNE